MTIRAVVVDIGGVLEIVDDAVFPGRAEQRLGLAAGTVRGVCGHRPPPKGVSTSRRTRLL